MSRDTLSLAPSSIVDIYRADDDIADPLLHNRTGGDVVSISTLAGVPIITFKLLLLQKRSGGSVGSLLFFSLPPTPPDTTTVINNRLRLPR